jgi:hypothetical protein
VAPFFSTGANQLRVAVSRRANVNHLGGGPLQHLVDIRINRLAADLLCQRSGPSRIRIDQSIDFGTAPLGKVAMPPPHQPCTNYGNLFDHKLAYLAPAEK